MGVCEGSGNVQQEGAQACLSVRQAVHTPCLNLCPLGLSLSPALPPSVLPSLMEMFYYFKEYGHSHAYPVLRRCGGVSSSGDVQQEGAQACLSVRQAVHTPCLNFCPLASRCPQSYLCSVLPSVMKNFLLLPLLTQSSISPL